MRFLFVSSHLCARASFRQALADLPLPSANSYPDSIGSSYRGLSPHKLMPMTGVHKRVQPTGWIGAILASGSSKKLSRSIEVNHSSRRLNPRPLGVVGCTKDLVNV
jgi:hypothetical protein